MTRNEKKLKGAGRPIASIPPMRPPIRTERGERSEMTREEAIKEAETQISVYESMILYNKDFEPRNDNSNYERKIEFLKMTIEALENQKWIPVSERLPNMEEYLKNDGRFILDDGNRRYQGLFDIYDKKFKFSKCISGLNYELVDDNCVIAWQPLPKPYMAEKHY